MCEYCINNMGSDQSNKGILDINDISYKYIQSRAITILVVALNPTPILTLIISTLSVKRTPGLKYLEKPRLALDYPF